MHGDPERLGQVLANLLDNALRHTPPGGHVRVASTRTAGRRRSRSPSPTTATASRPTSFGAVFDRFHRVDPARGRPADGSGSGLGLTIARAIITDHAGTLTAASPGPGEGSTFTLSLPAVR